MVASIKGPNGCRYHHHSLPAFESSRFKVERAKRGQKIRKEKKREHSFEEAFAFHPVQLHCEAMPQFENSNVHSNAY